MAFNEDTRVKIPCILHLMRLGYDYLSLKSTSFDEESNIFSEILFNAIAKINQNSQEHERQQLFNEIKLLLDNEDFGKLFYEKLISQSGIKLIDFENFKNNTLTTLK